MLTHLLNAPSIFYGWDFPYDSLFAGGLGALGNRTLSTSQPRMTAKETSSELLLTAELPGLRKEDIQVTIENGEITLSGERKLEMPEGYRVIRRERIPVRFAKSFKLTDTFDPEGIEAKLENGILSLTIKKRPEIQPRQITVKVSG